MDGQDGGNINLGRTDFELEHLDSQNEQERTESYKVIRTGEDEMAFFLKDDVDQPIEQGVLVKRGGVLAWEKTIEPTAELLMEVWIGMMSGTDATGLVWIPLDGKRSNGSRTGLISSKE